MIQKTDARQNASVIARPVRKLVVAIRIRYKNSTDSHTSDVGHWFGMTGLRILQRVCFPVQRKACFRSRSIASSSSERGRARFMRMESGQKKDSPFCQITPARMPRASSASMETP